MATTVRSRKRSATQKERWKGPDAQGCHATYREHIVAMTKAKAAERERLVELGRSVERGERPPAPGPGEPAPTTAPAPPTIEPPPGKPAEPPAPPQAPPASNPPKATGPAFGPRAWASRRARAS